MTSTLRLTLFIGVVLYFIIVLRLLKQKRLILKYSLLWLLMGIIFAILLFFPQIMWSIGKMFGIVDAMNGLFTFAIGFLMILVMALTSIASRQGERIKELTQNIAILEKRIRDLEKKKTEGYYGKTYFCYLRIWEK